MESTQNMIINEIGIPRLEVNSLRDEMEKEREDRERDRKVWEREIQNLKSDVSSLKKFEEKWNMQEKRERRGDLIIRGIKEDHGEEIMSKFKEIILLEEKLIQTANINSAQRIGKEETGRGRPIIAKFENLEDKWNITDLRRMLKGTNIYLDQDYPPEIRERRAKLFKKAKELRTENENRRILVTYDKLKMDGELYELKQNGEQEELIKVNQNQKNE